MTDISIPDWALYEAHAIAHHAATTGHVTYPWRLTPDSVLRDAGLIVDAHRTRENRRAIRKDPELHGRPEFGLDGIACETLEDGSIVYHGIQVKCRKRPITAYDLGSFFLAQQKLQARSAASRGFLTSKGPVHRLTQGYMDEVGYITTRLPFPEQASVPSTSAPLVLRPYQGEVVDTLTAGWKGMGLLSMPCGTGKTECVCAWLARCAGNFNVVIMASPLLAHVDQTKKRMEALVPDVKHVLVDGEAGGLRGVEDLKRIIDEAAGRVTVVLHTTFKSAEEVVGEMVEWMADEDKVVMVVDEAHNVPGRERLRQLVEGMPISLLVTATPTSAMMDEMGCQLLYEMPMRRAIEEKWVVDYNVYLPAIRRLADGRTEVDVDVGCVEEVGPEHDKSLIAKALFLAAGMLESGSRRCVTYLSSKQECVAFLAVMKMVVNEYHSLPFWGEVMTEDVRRDKRREMLAKFEGGDDRTLRVLASVHVLKEGVDMKRCDSVFISTVSDRANEARVVQMCMRANRVDPANPNKKAAVFMWAPDWSSAVSAMTMLREADDAFMSKVRVLQADYDRSTDITTRKAVEVQVGELQRFVEVRCVTVEQLFLERCKEVAAYAEENGRLPAYRDETLMAGVKRGSWVHHMKMALRGGGHYRLTPTQREILLAIPAFKAWYDAPEPRERREWDGRLEDLRAHVEEHGCLPNYKDDKQLYNWLSHQKSRLDKLTEDQRATLFAIDGVEVFFSQVSMTPWPETFEQVKAFEARTSRLPTRTDDKKLWKWCSKQVTYFVTNKLSDDRIAMLLTFPAFKARLEGHPRYNTHPYVIKHGLQTS